MKGVSMVPPIGGASDELTLDSLKISFIDYDDSPDTARRVAEDCLGRPDYITGLPDMAQLKAEAQRRFRKIRSEAAWPRALTV